MTDVDRLERRLARERAARVEAERIAEDTTRTLYERNQQLVLLESIADAANSAQSVESALQLALERLCRHLGWPAGYAWVWDFEAEMLVHGDAVYSADPARLEEFTRESKLRTFASGEGLPGRVFASETAVAIADVLEDSNFPRTSVARAAGLHGAVAFPVRATDRTVAVLEGFTRESGEPPAEMLHVLEQAGTALGRVFERALIEDQLRHQATHDSLTGLPNRLLFRDRLQQSLAVARRTPGSSVAVMIIDLDRFKEVNDTLGHQHGDALLAEVGMRLRGALRDTDTIARLGGDEFGLVLPLIEGEAAARVAAARLRVALADPLHIDGVLIQVDASVGTALYPQHGQDADTLVRQADVGMYEAKRSHAGHVIYSAERDPYSSERLGMVAALRRALESRHLILHYQPKVDVHEHAVRGVEALVRWQDPERGMIPPGDFIPLAERTGLIRPITTFVLREALAQVRAWLNDGLRVPVAVNLSARSLLDTGFPDQVAQLLGEARVPAELLELEVTESMMLEDPKLSREVLSRLDAMGISLSVDDFGTGYSSLAQLRRLPVSELKIDRGFVGSMQTDDRDAFIVRSSIQLGQNLGLKIVAEGVEDMETIESLRRLGCDIVQGYAIMRPVPSSELTGWLHEQAAAGVDAALDAA